MDTRPRNSQIVKIEQFYVKLELDKSGSKTQI